MAIKITVLTLLGMLLCCGSEPPATAVDKAPGEIRGAAAVPVIEPADAPVDLPVVEPADAPVDPPVVEPAETPGDPLVLEPADAPIDPPVIEPADALVDPLVVKPADAQVDPTVIEPANALVDPLVVEPADALVDPLVVEPVDTRVDPPVAGPATQPAALDQPPKLVVDAWNPTDELLERLERSHADLRDFQADIVYLKWDNVLKRDEMRTGEVLYQVKADGTKRFAILLERLIKGNRARDHRKHYVFDGSWLVEIDHEAKIFIKRQIVPPGKQFDPLKLGEGPFPLPVGQPADEVRARFKVRRLHEPTDETLAQRLAGRAVDGLRLEPKPGPQEKEFNHAELFYDRDSLLPVGVSVTEVNGDRKTVVLSNLKRNAGVDENKLSIEEPDPRDGWRKDIEPWGQSLNSE